MDYKNLIIFKKKEDSFSIIMASCFDVTTTNFKTKSKENNKKFPELYSSEFENHTQINRIITPKISYDLYEKTMDESECDLLGIDYYMGTDYKHIVKTDLKNLTTLLSRTITNRMFVVDEKLRVSKTNEDRDNGLSTGHYNNILEYTGWRNFDKKQEDQKYEGDMNTLIELMENCKYKMYKFVKNVQHN